MFDRLVDLLIEGIHLFVFWTVLEPYEQGVLLRLGRFVRVLEPGLTWVFPFGIDHVLFESVVPRTHSLPDQSCTTQDGRQVGFQSVITYRVRDINTALLEVDHSEDAIKDSCTGTICHVLSQCTWDEIFKDSGVLDKVLLQCRKRGFKYGIEILSVQFATISLVRTLRLLNK